ncbi:hypothetical protein [Moheibacter sp.]|uniref:hypothetical protein n=1 Tax=Moheibacter sp. TaxID=1965316 RepID=UPI003C76F39E
MREYHFIFFFLIIQSCTQNGKIKISVDQIENNQIHFSILNNLEDSIKLLKPKSNYLCYEGSPTIYKGYFILGFMDYFTMEQTYKSTILSEELLFESTPPTLSNYQIIIIKKGEKYSGNIFVPERNSTACIFYPIIDKNTVLVIRNDTISFKSDLIVALSHEQNETDVDRKKY